MDIIIIGLALWLACASWRVCAELRRIREAAESLAATHSEMLKWRIMNNN
jgi:hypothetical protein